MAYTTFVSVGLSRRYAAEGNLTSPSRAWLCLDGGEDAIGTSILSRLTPAAGEVFVAPDGVKHEDGTQTWIKPWTPTDAVLQPGVTRDSDLSMLVDLRRVTRERWASIKRRAPFVFGHSGGAGEIQDWLHRGAPDLFVAACAHKRVLHVSQVTGGAAIVPHRAPLLLWFSDNDPKYTPTPPGEHITMEATVEAYRRAYGVTGAPSVAVRTFAGFSYELRSYPVSLGAPPLAVVWMRGGGHELIPGSEAIVRDHFAGLGLL